MTSMEKWNAFINSGSIEDYLSYRSECTRQEEEDRAGSDKGNRDTLKEHGRRPPGHYPYA